MKYFAYLLLLWPFIVVFIVISYAIGIFVALVCIISSAILAALLLSSIAIAKKMLDKENK